VRVLPSPHRLRDTFASAAHEARIHPMDLKILLNHSLPGGDVTEDLRAAFRARLDAELRTALAARGLAEPTQAGQAVRRSLERVAIRRALELCHILTIRGRDFRWQ